MWPNIRLERGTLSYLKSNIFFLKQSKYREEASRFLHVESVLLLHKCYLTCTWVKKRGNYFTTNQLWVMNWLAASAMREKACVEEKLPRQEASVVSVKVRCILRESSKGPLSVNKAGWKPWARRSWNIRKHRKSLHIDISRQHTLEDSLGSWEPTREVNISGEYDGLGDS